MDTYNIVFGDPNATTTLYGDLDVLVGTFKHSQRCEVLLIDVVRNFIRKQNFSELNESLNDNEIDEKEYDKELASNSEKYAITLGNLKEPADIHCIIDLVFKIGSDLRDFSLSEISEMFSVKEDVLIAAVKGSAYHQLK